MILAGRNRGLTLVELIVSIGLFAVVMVVSTGAYLSVSGANRQAQAITKANTSLAFALESMVRTIRTGTNYWCGSGSSGDCPYPGGNSLFTVTPIDGFGPVAYAYDAGLHAITANGTVITDPFVQVNSLRFYATGTATGDSGQPHVTIVIAGTVPGVHGGTIPFTVETGATFRGTDL